MSRIQILSFDQLARAVAVDEGTEPLAQPERSEAAWYSEYIAKRARGNPRVSWSYHGLLLRMASATTPAIASCPSAFGWKLVWYGCGFPPSWSSLL